MDINTNLTIHSTPRSIYDVFDLDIAVYIESTLGFCPISTLYSDTEIALSHSESPETYIFDCNDTITSLQRKFGV